MINQFLNRLERRAPRSRSTVPSRPPRKSFNITLKSDRERFIDTWIEVSPATYDRFFKETGGEDGRLMIELLKQETNVLDVGNVYRFVLRNAGFKRN